MPRLPDATALGARPTPQTQRQTAAYQPTAYRGGIVEGAQAEAAAGAGQNLAQSVDVIGAGQDRIRTREEAVYRAKALTAYGENVAGEMRRLETEGDWSDPRTAKQFRTFIDKQQKDLLDQYGGSTEGKLMLAERIEGMRGSYVERAVSATMQAQRKLVADALAPRLSSYTDTAYNSPDKISDMFKGYDSEIDEMAGALSPEEETAYRSAGRQEIVLSAVNAYLDRGDAMQAQSLIADTPGVTEMLSPAQQRALNGRISAVQRADEEVRMSGVRKVREAEQILGRRLNVGERAKLAGVSSPSGPQTLNDKIAEVEGVLGRTLTVEERKNVAGIKTGDARTDAGKAVQDREMFVSQYGENSPQVKAFDEASTSTGGAKLSDIGGIRKEFTGLSKDFVQIRDSFGRIASAASSTSPAGDLALMFNYMKMLDPGSVVRESEFAEIAATGSYGQRMQGYAQRYLSGERLTDEQRQDLMAQAEGLMRTQSRSQIKLEEQYRGIADRSKIDPDDVVIDFMGPYRRTLGGVPADEPTAPGEAPPAEGAPAAPSAPVAAFERGPDGKLRRVQ